MRIYQWKDAKSINSIQHNVNADKSSQSSTALVLVLLILISNWSIEALQIPLPGGRRISYDDKTGVLRINLNPSSTKKKTATKQIPAVPPAGTLASTSTMQSISVRDTGIPQKGFGAFVINRPLDPYEFLGFYEGRIVHSREALDEMVAARQMDTDSIRGAMDYIMSLDGGVTFVDGYERAKNRTSFSPVHLNHADKDTLECNCIRLLDEGRVAFFTSRNIAVGEELCFDYGSNFWAGREQLKC